jgi:hypothetical protein
MMHDITVGRGRDVFLFLSGFASRSWLISRTSVCLQPARLFRQQYPSVFGTPLFRTWSGQCRGEDHAPKAGRARRKPPGRIWGEVSHRLRRPWPHFCPGFTHETHSLLIPGGSRLCSLGHRLEEPSFAGIGFFGAGLCIGLQPFMREPCTFAGPSVDAQPSEEHRQTRERRLYLGDVSSPSFDRDILLGQLRAEADRALA